MEVVRKRVTSFCVRARTCDAEKLSQYPALQSCLKDDPKPTGIVKAVVIMGLNPRLSINGWPSDAAEHKRSSSIIDPQMKRIYEVVE